MADDQEPNDVGEDGGVADYDGNDANDGNDIGDTADLIGTTAVPAQPQPIDEGGAALPDDYPDDEAPPPDYIVNLYIGDQSATDIAAATLTDEYGNVITTTWRDNIDGYTAAITQEIQDQITGNQTTIGGKGFWGDWNWHKGLIVGLIALCIIGIIIAVVFIILGRKNKNASGQGAAPSQKSKGKGVTQDPKYSAVPTNV